MGLIHSFPVLRRRVAVFVWLCLLLQLLITPAKSMGRLDSGTTGREQKHTIGFSTGKEMAQDQKTLWARGRGKWETDGGRGLSG